MTMMTTMMAMATTLMVNDDFTSNLTIIKIIKIKQNVPPNENNKNLNK